MWQQMHVLNSKLLDHVNGQSNPSPLEGERKRDVDGPQSLCGEVGDKGEGELFLGTGTAVR